MPRGQDSTNIFTPASDGYVWGDQGGVFGRFPVASLQGAAGPTGANGIYADNITDNTGASTDLALAAGEVAYIDISAASSTALNIATEVGLYELFISCVYSAMTMPEADILLQPNNTTYTSEIKRLYQHQRSTASSTISAGSATQSSFSLGNTKAVTCKALIDTKAKSVMVEVITATHTSGYGLMKDIGYGVFSAAWTSLGTIVFPTSNAHTGRILIRRII